MQGKIVLVFEVHSISNFLVKNISLSLTVYFIWRSSTSSVSVS